MRGRGGTRRWGEPAALVKLLALRRNGLRQRALSFVIAWLKKSSPAPWTPRLPQ